MKERGEVFGSIPFEVSDDMMRDSWLALDKSGQIIGCGATAGTLWTGDKKDVAKFKIGTEVYAALKIAADSTTGVR